MGYNNPKFLSQIKGDEAIQFNEQEFHRSNNNATTRLLKEHKEHGGLIIAVDFDNTIYDYHAAGADYSEVIDLVKRAIRLEHKIFIFTANQDHDFVIAQCLAIGLGVLPINTSEMDHLFPSRKPFYNILLDDRAGLASTMVSLTTVLDFQELNNRAG